jgi:hypothetical protein
MMSAETSTGGRVIRYVNRVGLAVVLGVTRQRVRDLEREGKLPAPDAMLGDRPLWRVETAERFARDRRQTP